MPRPLSETLLASGGYVESGMLEEAEKVQITFDDFIRRFQEQPSDAEAKQGILSEMNQAVDNGDVDFVLRNTMVLAAMACTDPHMEEISSEAGKIANRVTSRESLYDHGHNHDDEELQSKASKRASRKKRRQTARTLIDLIFAYRA